MLEYLTLVHMAPANNACYPQFCAAPRQTGMAPRP